MRQHICGQCLRIRHSLRAAATTLPPLRCAPPPRFALPPPPLTLPSPPCRHQASANVALARCVGSDGVVVGDIIAGGDDALSTAVDVSTCTAIAANNDDAVGAVVSLSLTNDKSRTLAPRWRSKAFASVHLRTVLVNPLQPPRCFHRVAAVALCASAALHAAATAADAAAAAVPTPSCR